MNNLIATTVIDGLFVLLVWIIVANAVRKLSAPRLKLKTKKGYTTFKTEPAEELNSEVKQAVDAQFYRRQRLDEEFAENSRIAAREAASKGQWPPREA